MALSATLAAALLGRIASIPTSEAAPIVGKGLFGPGVDPTIMVEICSLTEVDGNRLLEVILAIDQIASVHEDSRTDRIEQKFPDNPLTDQEAAFVRVYLAAVWTPVVVAPPPRTAVVDHGSRFTAPPLSRRDPRPPPPSDRRDLGGGDAEDSEDPDAPELPQVLKTFLAAVNGAHPSLAVAVRNDAWPGLRQEIEDAHRAAADQVEGAWAKLIRLSLRIHARVLAETSRVALADAAKAYADAAVGEFSHSSYQPQRTYELAWHIAVGHPYVPL